LIYNRSVIATGSVSAVVWLIFWLPRCHTKYWFITATTFNRYPLQLSWFDACEFSRVEFL